MAMENLTPVIRNAVRALIIREERILLLRKEDERGERFALPGGAQDLGETLEQALNRECQEEIGTGVRIIDLVHIADYFKARQTTPPSTRHLVEFLFTCRVADDYTPRNGHHPDKHQVEVMWAELDELERMPLHPVSLASHIVRLSGATQRVYLGVMK